ncbi:hypothetical protein ACFC0D_00170 [Streptomyces sp. NPDC056222]|uniref:hypothetical protein n=1 Tax=Streptomyces sp. NPDC056222 TaxID=3345749 RepID=UPI0035D5C306
MTLCDYFSAPDDNAAAAVVEMSGGPVAGALDVVHLKHIDPVVAIAHLEAIATGCSYEEAGTRPRSGELLSSPESEGSFVFSLSDTLTDALVAATPDDLAAFAEPWSMTAELQQIQVDDKTAAVVLEVLAGLARRARADGLQLYCWWSL